MVTINSYLLNYQDDSTKVICLRPLKWKWSVEVAFKLQKIFLQLGAAATLQNNNGHEFVNTLITELIKLSSCWSPVMSIYYFSVYLVWWKSMRQSLKLLECLVDYSLYRQYALWLDFMCNEALHLRLPYGRDSSGFLWHFAWYPDSLFIKITLKTTLYI